MKYFDSHTHPNDLKIFHEYDNVQKVCYQEHVYMNIVGCDLHEFETAIHQVLNNPYAYATIGIHPTNVYDKNLDECLTTIKQLVNKYPDKIVAIGEIGLDYHYENTNKEIQAQWFRAQIELAIALNKPIQMHIRDAMDDAITILKEYENQNLVAIFHCFSGTKDDIFKTQTMNIDFYYSFAGNLTYKNAINLQKAIEFVPLNKLLCETDAPYLTPVPFRGKTNYPYYVIYVYQWIAQKFHLDLDKLSQQILLNNQNVFKISNLCEFDENNNLKISK